MSERKGLFGLVNSAMDSTVGQIIPSSPEEIQMIARKRQQEREEAARILMQKQQPTVQVSNPNAVNAEANIAKAEAAQTQANAQAVQAAQPEVDENGRIKQTTFGGNVMDTIFGNWFK